MIYSYCTTYKNAVGKIHVITNRTHFLKTLNVFGNQFKANRQERNIEWKSPANSAYFLMHELFFSFSNVGNKIDFHFSRGNKLVRY